MRRQSFSGFVTAMAREAARAQRQAEAAERRRVRDQEAAYRQQQRLSAQAAKEAKQQYLEERADEVRDMNDELEERLNDLRGLLDHTLRVDDTIAFGELRLKEDFPLFSAPSDLTVPKAAPDLAGFMRDVPSRNWLHRVLAPLERKRMEAHAHAKERYRLATEEYAEQEQARKRQLAALQAQHEAERQSFLLKVQQRNAEVDEVERAYRAGDAEAVVTYCSMVLERSTYPDGLPQEFRIACIPESKEVAVEYELPGPEIIPQVTEYRYVKTRDAVDEKPRRANEIAAIYQDVVAAIALRTLHELFEADQGSHLESCVFNGFVQTTDPATGRDIKPCLVSVRATKAQFRGLDLAKVDKRSCLRNLGAQVSARPNEMVPVRPLVEFSMVDRRFVEHSDMLADLESRLNLMDLSPFEFENLVANLFESMGLETRLTRTSRDGGVDAVVHDPRPVLGGKAVIQAKRYRDTVGVSAVRDLYGTMMNEGANKGILVTTSGYGPDAVEFVKDKPIELIAGGQLLYLLQQHAGIEARIIFPEAK